MRKKGGARLPAAVKKGLRVRNSPICTLSQNGYGVGVGLLGAAGPGQPARIQHGRRFDPARPAGKKVTPLRASNGPQPSGSGEAKLTWLVLGEDPAARSRRVEQFTAL